MAALRIWPTGASVAMPFWFSALGAALVPTSLGYQDFAAFVARQSGIVERWGEHLIASPFGTIHAATFSFSRPIGTAMPEPAGAQPVNFDPSSLDAKTWLAGEPPLVHPAMEIAYPTVNRALKGDRLPLPQASPAADEARSLPQLHPVVAPVMPETPPPVPDDIVPTAPPAPPPAPTTRLKAAAAPDAAPAAASLATAIDAPAAFAPAAVAEAPAALAAAVAETHALSNPAQSHIAALEEHDRAGELEIDDGTIVSDKPPDLPPAGETERPQPAPNSSASFLDEDPAERSAQLYFGVAAMGASGGLEQWAPGAQPVLVSPALGTDIELAALEAPPDAGAESTTGKDASRLLSPADRLGLTGRPRTKAEKCLADAVYFEARGEPSRGQEAVAQVVMNRVFSGYYPNDVCGVVYQNANRYLACQFTFACEGRNLSRIDEPEMWTQAKRIAKDTLDGKIWLAEVGHATHYHAYWVHPSWVNEMRKMYKLGVHTFYRPRAWGDGSDAPIWGIAPDPQQPGGTAPERPEAAKDPGTAAKHTEAGV